MKMHTKRLFKILFENLDVILATIGIFIGLSIFFLSYIGKINQHFIGIILVLSCLMYLLIRTRLKENIIQNFHLSYQHKKILNIIFFMVIIFTFILWYDQLYSRPLIYFILLSLLLGLISTEIILFHKDDNVWPLIFKIFFVAFMIRGGIYYNFPSIVGYDAYTHTTIANVISTTGFVPPFEISDKYVNYPILHIFISITKIISFINIKDAVFFSIGLISIISTIFIYLFVNRFAEPRIGLLSVLIICLNTPVIVTGITNITAGSLVFCYFLALLYLFMRGDKHTNTFILCLFIMFIVIITHQLSTFVVFLSFCFLGFSIILFEHVIILKKQNFNFVLFLSIFGISMIIYWIYTAYSENSSFFEGMLVSFLDTLKFGGKYGSDVLLVGHKTALPFFDILMVQTGYLFLPFFAIGGIFFWLSRKEGIKFSIACTAAALFFLVYAIPFLGIRSLLMDRWMPFLSIFLGIVAAAYIVSCIDLIKSNTTKLFIIFTIVTIFSFLMVVTPSINKDYPLINKGVTVRNQFTNSEIIAAETIGSIYDGLIYLDGAFWGAYIFYSSPTPNKYADIREHTDIYDIFDPDTTNSINGEKFFILRTSTLYEPVPVQASKLYGDEMAVTIPQNFFDEFETPRHNLVYNSRTILGYV